MKHLYHATLIGCFVIIAFAVLYGMYLAADGVYFNKPIKIDNAGQLQTSQTDYHIGDTVEAYFSFCKTRNINETFQWELIDTYIRFYPAVHSALLTGCYRLLENVGEIPADVHVGAYHFSGEVTYHINSLTTVSYPITTNTFFIDQ